MAEIRFEKLPLLLKDMRRKQRKIELFPFRYNGIECIVLLTLLEENDSRKLTRYTVVGLEFIKVDKENDVIVDTISATADFYKVEFDIRPDFYKFFNINRDNPSENASAMFDSFIEHFAKFIPEESIIKTESPSITKRIMARLDPENPNAIYCYNVKRSGIKKDGKPKKRTLENSEKAQRLRPELYDKYQQDDTYSFYFSDDPEKHRSYTEIMMLMAKR